MIIEFVIKSNIFFIDLAKAENEAIAANFLNKFLSVVI